MPTLRWLTRDDDVRTAEKVPYRLLEEVPKLGYGTREAGNMLIQGDNLEALKALLPYYAGQVNCICIDPPYNTGSAFEHYDDNLEHTQWLAMMYPRLELLRDLLREDGSIWVSIDDDESHYLKVILDEVFGRKNFIGNVVWQKRFSPNSTARYLSDSHDHIMVYAKPTWERNMLPRTEKTNSSYKNPDDDPRGVWTSSDLSARNPYSAGQYSVTTPKGRRIEGPPPGRYWTVSEENFLRLDAEDRIWWGKNRDNQPRLKRFLRDVRGGVVPQTIWGHEEVGHTQEAKKEVLHFNGSDVFATPKPERLIQRILHIATNPGDLVLDSFLGSGTTAAVAQKMGRRYIGIEMGDHAVTHCVPRLQKVGEGEQGGISRAQNWEGGGGFRFYRLGPPVFTEDGRIHPDIRFPVLAAHIWFAETGHPWTEPHPLASFLGTYEGKGFALLFNGILGDKSISGGNVLTHKTLAAIRSAQGDYIGPLTVYGVRTALLEATLRSEMIEFKQTPYDVKVRK